MPTLLDASQKRRQVAALQKLTLLRHCLAVSRQRLGLRRFIAAFTTGRHLAVVALLSTLAGCAGISTSRTRTSVAIDGEKFLINGRPTYAGRVWDGVSIEGRLMNSRMVQGTFDDLNPETRSRWTYPDGRPWDPERNTNEFIAAAQLVAVEVTRPDDAR